MSTWTNEAGEPIMSGEAWRFEQYLDSLAEHDQDDFYARQEDDDGPVDPATCSHPDLGGRTEGGWECDLCETVMCQAATGDDEYCTRAPGHPGDHDYL